MQLGGTKIASEIVFSGSDGDQLQGVEMRATN